MESLVGILFLLLPLAAWLLTIRDIYRSDFENDNKWKQVWLWSVVVTGYVAMTVYYLIGVRKKVRAFRFLRSANIYKYC